MNKSFKAVMTLGLISLLAVPITAATKAPVKKAPAKPAAKPTTKPHVVQGTKQWSGENADPGTAYTLEKKINFTLSSLEYSIDPLGFTSSDGDPATEVVTSEEKFIILHFTLHNPLPQEQKVLWATAHFTVVDDQNTNHEGIERIGVEKDKSKLWIDLKPGQKVDCYSAVKLPAKAKVAKLIVKGENPDQGVLRYYKEKLKIKPLAAPFADPADKTGACALGEIPAQQSIYYPMKTYAVRLDGVSYTNEQVEADTEVPEESRYVVCSVTFKNIGVNDVNVGWGEFSSSKLTTDQDEDITSYLYLLPKAKRGADYAELKPGQEKSVRMVFAIKNDSNAKTLTMREGDDSRCYVFDLSGVK